MRGFRSFVPTAASGEVAPEAVCARASHDGGRLSNAERGQMTVGMREISR